MIDFNACWSWLLTYLVHSTLCLGGVWFLFRWGKWGSPGLKETVWKFAAVAPVVTAVLQTFVLPGGWSISVVFSETATASKRMTQNPAANLSVNQKELGRFLEEVEATLPRSEPFLAEHFFRRERVAEQTSFHFDEPATAATKTKTGKKPAQLPGMVPDSEKPAAGDEALLKGTGGVQVLWWGGGLLVLVAGFGVVRLFKNFGQLNWALQNATPLRQGPLVETLNRLTARFQIQKPVRLFQLEQISEPAASGWINWCILLPVGIEEQLSEDELEAALSHELAHLVRHDVWWLWIGRGLTWMCPFQPLNFVAHREWHLAAESLSDLWAVDKGVSRFSLARSLTTVATRASRERVAFSMSVTGSGGEHLTTRVENLMEEQDDRYRSRGKRLFVLGTGCLLAGGLLAWVPHIEIQANGSAGPKGTSTATNRSEGSPVLSRQWQPFHEHYLKSIQQEAGLLETELGELIPLSGQHSVEVQKRTRNMNERGHRLLLRLKKLQQKIRATTQEE